MKKSLGIISAVIVIVLILGSLYSYGKYLDLKNKNETKTNKSEVSNNEIGANDKITENGIVSDDLNNNVDDKSAKNEVKNTVNDKSIKSTSNENIGKIEISALNLKEDLLSSQIKYTSVGLNKIGNSVIDLENDKYAEITENMEIYVRNAEEEKVVYKVYDIYESTKGDTSFYESDTQQIEITLIVELSENILVIKARKQ